MKQVWRMNREELYQAIGERFVRERGIDLSVMRVRICLELERTWGGEYEPTAEITVEERK